MEYLSVLSLVKISVGLCYRVAVWFWLGIEALSICEHLTGCLAFDILIQKFKIKKLNYCLGFLIKKLATISIVFDINFYLVLYLSGYVERRQLWES